MPRPPRISGDIYRWGSHYENLTAWWRRRLPLLVTDGDGLQCPVAARSGLVRLGSGEVTAFRTVD